jgi:hypothetical protein
LFTSSDIIVAREWEKQWEKGSESNGTDLSPTD